jgi:beta propeller repeat protein
MPIIISFGLFIGLRPAFAQIIEGQQISLSDYVKSNNVEVGIEAIDGYTQVYYVFDGQKTFITHGAVNSNIPVTDGAQIVYRQSLAGGDQLFLYNLITEQSIQISTSGTNSNPKINGKNIVWEGMVDGNWQIFLYDGMKVTQLTSGDMSINAEIEGDFIIYARRDITGTWRSEIYSISKKEAKGITIGTASKQPKVRNGKIFLGADGSEEEFTLTVDDIFLLDLAPLTATGSEDVEITDQPPVTTIEEVISELQATSSAFTQ